MGYDHQNEVISSWGGRGLGGRDLGGDHQKRFHLLRKGAGLGDIHPDIFRPPPTRRLAVDVRANQNGVIYYGGSRGLGERALGRYDRNDVNLLRGGVGGGGGPPEIVRASPSARLAVGGRGPPKRCYLVLGWRGLDGARAGKGPPTRFELLRVGAGWGDILPLQTSKTVSHNCRTDLFIWRLFGRIYVLGCGYGSPRHMFYDFSFPTKIKTKSLVDLEDSQLSVAGSPRKTVGTRRGGALFSYISYMGRGGTGRDNISNTSWFSHIFSTGRDGPIY